MPRPLEIIEAPLATGIGLLGVEQMAGALRAAGLEKAVDASATTTLWEP